MTKRAYTIKVIGFEPFTMLIMDADTNAAAEHICRCIFGERLQSVE